MVVGSQTAKCAFNYVIHIHRVSIKHKKAEPKLRQKTPAEVVLADCLEPFVTR
jgi:hypothetical protein